ncbi:MAG: 2-dehydropantoate 2-reductase [Nitrospirae bacterium]|nr:2-dehydropantoate 2-reductase [Nitrospirota bacterium]
MAHSTPERVLVAGAGALGSVFGGFLARAGLDVTLLGRAPLMAAIERGGLTVTGLWGTHHVDRLRVATDAAHLAGPFDTILLCVKSWDTLPVMRALAPLLAVDGLAVSVQNGLGNVEALAAAVGPERAAGARVIFGAEVTAPGRVAVTVYAAPVLIGTLDGTATPAQRARIDGLVAALGRTPIPTESTPRLLPALWAKVLYNAALNPLGALLGVPYGELADSPHTRAVMDRVVAEALQVARAIPVGLPWDTAADYLQVFYGELVPATARHRSSMLQDLERGRPTEVDAINGQVVAAGTRLGIPTPVNAALADMIRFRAGRPG